MIIDGESMAAGDGRHKKEGQNPATREAGKNNEHLIIDIAVNHLTP
jgi:hypothetical protein